MMNKIILLTIIGFVISDLCFSQSIRKDYREMTSQEKQAYVDALYELWSEGTIQSFANTHMNNEGVAHNNERFLPWHRIFIRQMEEELQSKHQQIAIPYWNWPEDNSTNPAWNDSTFLGQFDNWFMLWRTLGDFASLPTQNQINSVQSLTTFSEYGGTEHSAGNLESVIHNPPHNWVGGVMSGPQSPLDPIFYFHHSMVDKLWQDWTGQSVFSSNSLNFSPFGMLNPHDYVDSRTLNVWYAENGVVLLDDYQTSGTNDYSYTGKIKSEDFIVASSSNVTFTAGTSIVLGPGFKTETGSTFYADVDAGVGNILSQMSGKPLVDDHTNREKQDAEQALQWALTQNYPNPFNPVTIIRYELPQSSHVRLEVFDLLGRQVATLVNETIQPGQHQIRFDASRLASGVYIYRLHAGEFVQTRQMTLVK